MIILYDKIGFIPKAQGQILHELFSVAPPRWQNTAETANSHRGAAPNLEQAPRNTVLSP